MSETRLGKHAQVRINGPWWRIALDNPARADACRQAAADARRKAEAYAEALGVRLGAVEEVTEPGLARREPERRSFRVMAAMSMPSDDAPDLRVEAGELDIRAAVEVVFRLEPN